MTFKKPDASYWDRKFIAYMHDPLDKIFRIQGHGQRAAEFLEKYGLQKTNEEFWKKADGIAAGFERGQVPSYSSDPTANGAINFLDNPIITHPTSETARLKIAIPDSNVNTARDIHEKLIDFIEKEIGIKAGLGGYSDKFKGQEDQFAVARFLYTHLVLRFKLAEQNIGGLGGFWHRVPADTRFPDHSIWQHNALCSAFCSCIELAGDDSEIGMMVFSITPVQAFISKARKLRDYWTGSVLLAWLAFEGMRWIMENLGPDHIVYPSLIDQPLVNEYMIQNWKVTQDGFLNPPKDIATFPNKFLFLIPMNQAEAIAEEIKHHIQSAWMDLNKTVCDTTTSKMGDFLSDEQKMYVKEIFERQNSGFWDQQWAASYLVKANDRSEIEKLLPKSIYEKSFKLLEGFNKIIADKPHYDKSGRGALYSVSHSLVQSALAVSKNKKSVTRQPETGEKCHLCGEFEVLHHKRYSKDMSAGEYKKGIGEFWQHLRKQWDGDEKNNLGYNLNENEKLCSICLTKRMASDALRGNTDHILQSIFTGKSFPTTTDIALTSYFEREEKRLNISIPENKRKQKAQEVHEKADEKTDNHDRYFAILMMDGDKMGDLVNGKTMGSTWESVMHPDIVERMKQSEFDAKYRDNWKDIFNEKRLVTPAIHAAISECLGDFSLYGVSDIIKKYQGTLIYAGGDDVCAVLPVETALNAAQKIRQYYTSTYKWIRKGQAPEDIGDSWTPAPGKLSINLGKGEKISISAGILICHHKESLTQMIDEAHHLLNDKAKKEAGRNACAIELRKRSGGSRFFVRQWCDEQAWESFSTIGDAVRNKNKAQVSTSVVYRLEQLRDGINAILKHDNWRSMLEALILKQLDRSSVGEKNQQEIFASRMADISIFKNSKGKYEFKPESLIVAAFMAKGGNNE